MSSHEPLTVGTVRGMSTDLLPRFDVAGPRYPSYPTAERFVEAFSPGELSRALQQRAQGRAIGRSLPSIDVHVQCFESVCYDCAFNKVVTRDHRRAKACLDTPEREQTLHAQAQSREQRVFQLHLGRGAPHPQAAHIRDRIRDRDRFSRIV